MTKYSDFVKSYMAKHGKTWNCAVCEIKKSGAYEKFKKGDTDKKEVAPVKKYVRKPLPFTVGDIARRAYEAEQRDLMASKVKTIAPSPIPAAAPLVEKPAIRQPTAPLVMPEILGKMIQDFVRPTEDTLIKKRQELPLKRNALLALLYAIRGRTNFTETESFYEIGWVDGQRENIKEKKLKAYLKKIDALIKKAKKKATIDESEVDDYFYDMSSERVAKTDDQVVAIKYLEKHDFYIKRRNIYETYRWGGEVHTTNTIDRVTWNIHYSIRNTRDMFKELTEMVKEVG
jgi:hypothetical protein